MLTTEQYQDLVTHFFPNTLTHYLDQKDILLLLKHNVREREIEGYALEKENTPKNKKLKPLVSAFEKEMRNFIASFENPSLAISILTDLLQGADADTAESDLFSEVIEAIAAIFIRKNNRPEWLANPHQLIELFNDSEKLVELHSNLAPTPAAVS